MRLWKYALPVLVLATGVTPAQGVSDQTVSYRGYEVTVPASWPVVDLTKDPTACVRFDRPAVYLGASTSQANCPAHLADRSEGIVLEPLTKAPLSTDGEIQVASQDAGVLATAYYAPGGEQSARQVLSTARVTTKSFRAAVTPKAATAATASIVATGALTAPAFDACTAPSQTAMNAWTASPYKAVGIYISGGLRACGQPNLTPDWVVANHANGWQFLLVDLGMQAPCTNFKSRMSTDPATARAQGSTAADAAITSAAALGFAQRSAIYSDIEAYTSTASCKASVLSYLSGWTNELNSRGYVAGAYVGVSSGGVDLSSAYTSTAYTRPDNLWFARYSTPPVTDTSDNKYIPPTYWANHQRVHQYVGGHDETYGGVKINVDSNAVDVTPPPAPLAAFTGTGASGSASLRWTVPADTTVGQVIVRRNTGTTPPGLPNSGTAVYAGTAASATTTGLANATTYTFRAWVKDSTGKVGPGVDLRLTGTGSTIAASSSSILYGSSVNLYSRLTRVDTRASVVGVPMTLYARPKNGTTFTAVATTTSSSSGSVGAVLKPTVSTVYVWGYNGSSSLLGSRSGNLTVEVRPTITANLTATTINLGATTSFYGYMRPQHPGTTVYLQRQSGTSWPSVATTKLNTTGNYAFGIKPTARGTYNYRAVWIGDADHATTVSAIKTVTVK